MSKRAFRKIQETGLGYVLALVSAQEVKIFTNKNGSADKKNSSPHIIFPRQKTENFFPTF